jgi:hypothetical protein
MKSQKFIHLLCTNTTHEIDLISIYWPFAGDSRRVYGRSPYGLQKTTTTTMEERQWY